MAADGNRWPAAFVAALAIGLLVRVAIVANTHSLSTRIVDEQHYAQLAANIADGNGLAWGPGEPTSIRPPLYPAMVAALWSATGTRSLQVIRIAQVFLALLSVWVVYLLGARVYSPAAGRCAAAAFWLYPSFIFFNALILTETLFTLLLVTFLLFAVRLVQTPSAIVAVACGAALGLAALTRSVLWPVPLLFCPLLLFVIQTSYVRRLALAACVLAAFAAVVSPWAIRNTRLQGVTTIVDTMGGINLRMGNYEFTPEDRMWDAVSLTGSQNWMHGYEPAYPGEPVTEGTKEKWAQRKAVQYMREHPAQTLRRSLIKFADFWGLEREFLAGVQQRLYAPPSWFVILASIAIVVGYASLAMAGAAGVWLAAPADKRLHVILLLPVFVILGAHTIVFGHARYHLPLMPILALYASALSLRDVRAFRVSHRPLMVAAAVTVTILCAVWIRQLVVTDADRIRALFSHGG